MIDPLAIDGTQPHIEGQCCEELLAEEYLHEGKACSTANVVHLCFGSRWHRLYFDNGIVFWRESKQRPEPYPMHELRSEVCIADLGALYGVRGARLDRIETRSIEGGTEVGLYFAGERTVRFKDVHDVTTHAA